MSSTSAVHTAKYSVALRRDATPDQIAVEGARRLAFALQRGAFIAQQHLVEPDV